jgi:hypothetical protein
MKYRPTLIERAFKPTIHLFGIIMHNAITWSFAQLLLLALLIVPAAAQPTWTCEYWMKGEKHPELGPLRRMVLEERGAALILHVQESGDESLYNIVQDAPEGLIAIHTTKSYYPMDHPPPPQPRARGAAMDVILIDRTTGLFQMRPLSTQGSLSEAYEGKCTRSKP